MKRRESFTNSSVGVQRLFPQLSNQNSLQLSFTLGKAWKFNAEKWGLILHIQVLSKQQKEILNRETLTQLWSQKSHQKSKLVAFMVKMGFQVYYYSVMRFWLWSTFLCMKHDKSSRLLACKLIYWIVLEPAYSFSLWAFDTPPFILFDCFYNKLQLYKGKNGATSCLIRPVVSKTAWLSALV